MARLFFLLSGEHPDLPMAELRAILEAEACRHRVAVLLPQVVLLEADESCIKCVAGRASMMRSCGLTLFDCTAKADSIYREARALKADDFLGPDQSFVVRIKRVQASSPDLYIDGLEREIGAAILEGAPRLRVNLKRPDRVLLGILSG